VRVTVVTLDIVSSSKDKDHFHLYCNYVSILQEILCNIFYAKSITSHFTRKKTRVKFIFLY